jgi:hypothetical protein
MLNIVQCLKYNLKIKNKNCQCNEGQIYLKIGVETVSKHII